MALKLKNKQGLNKYILQQGLLIEASLVRELEIMIARLENHAKLNAGYEDQSSNLKGSIGGVVLKNGRPISFAGFDSEGTEGNTKGINYINSLIPNYQQGYVILVVAGMNYATYVEDIHNLNVLKKTELKMNRDLPLVFNRLKQTFK